MIEKEQVVEVLKKVNDPEIMVDIMTLELVRDITITDGKVHILMTLTTPMCPYGPQLLGQVIQEVSQIKSVKIVEIELTFNPPWEPNQDLRAMLGN